MFLEVSLHFSIDYIHVTDVNPFIAMKPQEVTDSLKLNQLKDKIWYVVPSCAVSGEGLLEGLAWLSNNVKSPPAGTVKK